MDRTLRREAVCERLRYASGRAFEPASEFVHASPYVPKLAALADWAADGGWHLSGVVEGPTQWTVDHRDGATTVVRTGAAREPEALDGRADLAGEGLAEELGRVGDADEPAGGRQC